MTFCGSRSVGQMFADHFCRQAWKLVGPGNVTGRDCAQECGRSRIAQARVDEADVASVIMPGNVISLDIDSRRGCRLGHV